MISACLRCTLAGFAASVLVHLGIASAVFLRDKPEKPDLVGERQVAVSLAMFSSGGQQAEDGTRTDEPESERESVPAAIPIEPAPIPAPEPEFEPISKASLLTKPEQQATPEVKVKVKPKPKPKPKSEPESKQKPTSVSKPGLKSKPMERAIAKKRRYSSSARRRGDTVSFAIAKNGRISNARVDKSSGSSALEKAAVATLRRLGQYKPIPKALDRSKWSLRVPIRFALE